MTPRIATSMAMGAGLALCLVFAGLGFAQPLPTRIPFQIATGSTGGVYFPAGELIAGLLSHPQGSQRCEKTKLCGPTGLIMTARTSEGAAANVAAVGSMLASSGLAQAEVVEAAVVGKGAFRKDGPRTHLRVIASLFPEDVHLLVAIGSNIHTVSGLKGKRVALGSENSGTRITARAVLAAWRLHERGLKASFDGPDVAAQKLEHGELDAMFLVGGTPMPVAENLIRRKIARLVPLSGQGRTRLIAAEPAFAADTLPPGTYSGSAAVETVKTRAVWIVNEIQPEALIYAMTRALFEPGNAAALHASPALRHLSLEAAPKNPPAPLHPGAARFYRERGLLPKPVK